ncbi:hypothetical protein O181_041682 [Austropuccinia psidii MF-1]|uniref:Uncharacterized protein n=1 Tax=Austropuccinia psidii MF-1 TaxID=1389203 RepID=A0A9Q3DH64_9BASI|nr:hypothetical protein [Austropuccinia psidii MF-1]
MDPPNYFSTSSLNPISNSDLIPSSSSQSVDSPDFIINLTPLAPNLTFLTGHLGIETASIQGEIQFKIISSNPKLQFLNLSINFLGQESSHLNPNPIQFYFQTKSLWSNPSSTSPNDDHSSDSISSKSPSNSISKSNSLVNKSNLNQQSYIPPSSSPFQFNLSSPLPHCIHHLDGSGLSYQLEAQLTYQTLDCLSNHLKRAHIKLPVHLSTYSNHNSHPFTPIHPSPTNSSNFSLSPIQINLNSPTPIKITISQTLLRPSEPLALQIRIPPPSKQLMYEKGLQLRSVRAQLYRHIRFRKPINQSNLIVPPYDSIHSPHSNHSQLDELTTTTTVLAMSGKSCRFSSTRPVFLRLTLHSRPSNPLQLSTPSSISSSQSIPFISGSSCCNPITQSTILHDVYFTVLVTINITGRGGEQQDIKVERDIGIVPDRPPLENHSSDLSPEASLNGKAREAAEEILNSDESKSLKSFTDRVGPAPTYFESNQSSQFFEVGESSRGQVNGLELQEIEGLNSNNQDDDDTDEEEEEYDGYESYSYLAGQDGPAPPTIHEDEPPPPAPNTPPAGLEIETILNNPSDLSGSNQLDCIQSNHHTLSNVTSNILESLSRELILEDQTNLRAMRRIRTQDTYQEDHNQEQANHEIIGRQLERGVEEREQAERSERSQLEEVVGGPPAYVAGIHHHGLENHQSINDSRVVMIDGVGIGMIQRDRDIAIDRTLRQEDELNQPHLHRVEIVDESSIVIDSALNSCHLYTSILKKPNNCIV